MKPRPGSLRAAHAGFAEGFKRLVKDEAELRRALADLLYVINHDKDGGWFICEEGRDAINAARKALRLEPLDA